MRIRRLLCGLLLTLFCCSSAHAAKRNVVLFVTDDQGIEGVGCYGNDKVKTPTLDSLAADGTRFTYAFCTTASCSASRSVILTGLHNHANGHYGHQHHFHKFSSYTNIVGLPVWLNHANYRTGRCGKYHVAPESVYQFQTAIPGGSRSPVQMADNCKAFIEADDTKPFFLYFCTSDPHRGGGVDNSSPHKPDRFGNKPNGAAYPGIKEVMYDPDDVYVPPYLPDTPTCRAELANYYQSVSRIDQGLARLITILKEAGKWDDTLFIYISDHGIAFPGAKTTVYEPGMRAPCIVRNPYNAKRGVVSSAMVSWVDLTPTILDFAGVLDAKTGRATKELVGRIPAPPRNASSQNTRDTPRGVFHGRSILPTLAQADTPGWDVAYASHTFHEIQMYYPMRVVRERQYKLIWNIAHPLPFPFASDLWAAPTFQAQYKQGMDAPYGPRSVGRYIQRPKFELFDVMADPWESNDLSADPKHAETLERLKAKLKAFQQRTGDHWAMKWRYE